jgi:hypothetical protein
MMVAQINKALITIMLINRIPANSGMQVTGMFANQTGFLFHIYFIGIKLRLL